MPKHLFAFPFYAFLLMHHVPLSLFQRRNGVLMSPYSVTSSVGERRLVAWFQVGGAQRGEQDLYRCITQSTYGAAVSNFAELIVRGISNVSFNYILVLFICKFAFVNNLMLVREVYSADCRMLNSDWLVHALRFLTANSERYLLNI